MRRTRCSARSRRVARRARYAAGERVYSAGADADDIFIVVSGRIEHVFTPEVGARDPLKRMTRGGVFGWAGLCSARRSGSRP